MRTQMGDPFGDMDAALETLVFKRDAQELLDAYKRKDAKRVGELRTNPRLEAVFQFMQYYDAAKAVPQQTTVMKDIELKYPGIVKAFNQGELLNMVMRGKGRRRTGRVRRARGRRRNTRRR